MFLHAIICQRTFAAYIQKNTQNTFTATPKIAENETAYSWIILNVPVFVKYMRWGYSDGAIQYYSMTLLWKTADIRL